jgi:hypothetical protein
VCRLIHLTSHCGVKTRFILCPIVEVRYASFHREAQSGSNARLCVIVELELAKSLSTFYEDPFTIPAVVICQRGILVSK